MPDGVLINGKGPYKYNTTVPDGIQYETVNVDPGSSSLIVPLYVCFEILVSIESLKLSPYRQNIQDPCPQCWCLDKLELQDTEPQVAFS